MYTILSTKRSLFRLQQKRFHIFASRHHRHDELFGWQRGHVARRIGRRGILRLALGLLFRLS